MFYAEAGPCLSCHSSRPLILRGPRPGPRRHSRPQAASTLSSTALGSWDAMAGVRFPRLGSEGWLVAGSPPKEAFPVTGSARVVSHGRLQKYAVSPDGRNPPMQGSRLVGSECSATCHERLSITAAPKKVPRARGCSSLASDGETAACDSCHRASDPSCRARVFQKATARPGGREGGEGKGGLPYSNLCYDAQVR
ncbi:hypothetical protein GGR56DRAFT_509244 [Xylariaceae sp. FL0804]|nr:hypothetical protein GGR56DRAFT_509244 [Xylariaceae sp. FL0804]